MSMRMIGEPSRRDWGSKRGVDRTFPVTTRGKNAKAPLTDQTVDPKVP
jgi:hypothetical protein